MFIHGLHVVTEVRERVMDGDTSTSTEVYLSREQENGSSILVTFSGKNIATLTLLGSRPFIGVQYSLPPSALELFLHKFPVGSLVSSTLSVPSSGKKSLILRRFAEDGVTLADTDFGDLFAAADSNTKANPVVSLNLDSKFAHVWEANGRMYEFLDDGSYFVLDRSDYDLRNSGMSLKWGSMQFDRLSGDPSDVAGHWLSNAGDEDVLLRADGTYTWHTAGELPDALGNWAILDGKINSAELRAHCSTNGSQITFDAVYSGSYVGDYAFSNGDKELTISFNGVPVIYIRP